MAADDPISTKDFGASFKGFLDKIADEPDREPELVGRFREHFGADARVLPIVAETFDRADHRTSTSPSRPTSGDSWEKISPDLTTNDPEKLKQESSGGLTVDNSTAENQLHDLHYRRIALGCKHYMGRIGRWEYTDYSGRR